MKFVNYSNHPSERWIAQLQAAEIFGTVIDAPFPRVSPLATTEEIKKNG